ncbi:hypothetical protein KKC32_01995 [Patescibacteria group bacterium]|nr:hypothetical protein [Patescibacteria group bacterium]
MAIIYIAGIFICIVVLLLFIWSISNAIGLIRARGVPYVPLSRRQLQAIEKNIKLNSDDILIDLGCGDGRVLRMFERQGVKNLSGYEVNFWAYLKSKIINKFTRSKSKIYFKNFKTIDLSKFNIVFCYLLEGYLARMREQFEQQLSPGTKIISYGFEIKDWREPKIIYTDKENKKLGRIFIYEIK